MLKKLLIVTTLTVAVAASAAAEGRQDSDFQQAAQAEKSQPAQTASRPPTDPANIRLELTISVTDQRGAALWPAKIATLHVVDRDRGSIRVGQTSGAVAINPNAPADPAPVLNVDANPNVVSPGRVRVGVSFEYRPGMEAGKGVPIHVNERLSAVLDDGKPIVVSQTADPSSDRIVKVELKATIVK